VGWQGRKFFPVMCARVQEWFQHCHVRGGKKTERQEGKNSRVQLLILFVDDSDGMNSLLLRSTFYCILNVRVDSFVFNSSSIVPQEALRTFECVVSRYTHGFYAMSAHFISKIARLHLRDVAAPQLKSILEQTPANVLGYARLYFFQTKKFADI